MRLTFSCVSFLNALPFVEGLRALPALSRPRLILDPPFRCADRLQSSEVDAALIPSIEFARMDGAVPAGDMGIASLREVRSVALLSRIDPGKLRSVAVDINSRTSVALLRLILARDYACRPTFQPARPDLEAMLRGHDAALLIGDAALRASHSGLHVIDLADAWHRMTGLPFVFALWAARDHETALRSAELLRQSLPLGMDAVRRGSPAVAAARAELGHETVHDYLTRNIHYLLGDEEKESLRVFFRLCHQEGILAGAIPA